MKRKSIILLCVVLSFIILQINLKLSIAEDKANLFDEILLQTKSETVEYGLKTVFKTEEDPEEFCNELLESLELNNSEMKMNIVDNQQSYSINFFGENVNGYIESRKYNNEEVVTIDINKLGNENGLQSLKNKIIQSIGYRGENIKYFQYLKAKILDDGQKVGTEHIYSVNEKIIKILKSHETKNIETVNINNGLSTVAYTRKYDEKVNNNKLIDFNFAVCNYSSGNYIIIGTPEIITTY